MEEATEKKAAEHDQNDLREESHKYQSGVDDEETRNQEDVEEREEWTGEYMASDGPSELLEESHEYRRNLETLNCLVKMLSLQSGEQFDAREEAASALALLSKHLRTELATAKPLKALVGLLAENESDELKFLSAKILSNITTEEKARSIVCSFPGVVEGLLSLLRRKNVQRDIVCSFPEGLFRLLRRKKLSNRGPLRDPQVQALRVFNQVKDQDSFVEQIERLPWSLSIITDMLTDEGPDVQITGARILEALAANGTETMQFNIAECPGALKCIGRLLKITDTNKRELQHCAARVLRILAGHTGASLKILNSPKLLSILQSVERDVKALPEVKNLISQTLKELENTRQSF